MTQTFEELIKDEYYRERDGMCLMCTEYCWLHNPFIHCQYMQDLERSDKEYEPRTMCLQATSNEA